MPNVNAPSGLKPRKMAAGGGIPGRASPYTLAAGLAANIFRGDLVKSTGTGRDVTVCAAGDRSVGVFQGVQYVAQNGDVIFSPNWVSGTSVKSGTRPQALVFDDPLLEFSIQASAALAETDIGNFADITAATAGSTLTGQSGMQLDSTTVTATTATGGQLKILGLLPEPGNDYGTNAKVRVRINEHEMLAGTTAGNATQAT